MPTADPRSILIERREETLESQDCVRRVVPGEARTTSAMSREDLRYKLGPDGKPRSVTLVKSMMYRGTSTTGKTFSRWKTKSIKSIVVTSSGKQVLFSRFARRGAKGAHCMPHYSVEGWYRGRDPLFVKAQELLGTPPSFYELYPLAQEMGFLQFELGDSAFLRHWLHAADVQTLTRNLFGKTRYRKDLVKAVAAADPLGIWIAWSMRGLVPVDWLVQLMRARARREGDRRHDQPGHRPLRPHLRALDRPSLRRLIRDAGSDQVRRLIGDVVISPVPQPVRVRSWEELHNHTARHHRQAMRAQNFHARQLPSLSEEDKKKAESARVALEGRTDGGIKIVAARDADTLLGWGTTMGNCIAGYADPMYRGERVLLGMYEGSKLIANAEVTGGKLRQLLGPFNHTLSADRRADVEAFLTERGVSTSRNYWGDGR